MRSMVIHVPSFTYIIILHYIILYYIILYYYVVLYVVLYYTIYYFEVGPHVAQASLKLNYTHENDLEPLTLLPPTPHWKVLGIP